METELPLPINQCPLPTIDYPLPQLASSSDPMQFLCDRWVLHFTPIEKLLHHSRLARRSLSRMSDESSALQSNDRRRGFPGASRDT